MLLMGVAIGANAQYQLANSDFEQWESLVSGEEPVRWSSFVLVLRASLMVDATV